eukprot:g4060.t1
MQQPPPAAAKSSYLGQTRGQPADSLQSIQVDGFRMPTNFLAVLNTARHFLRKPMEVKRMLGIGRRALSYTILLQQLADAAKKAQKLRITPMQLERAIAASKDEAQGPHGVRTYVVKQLGPRQSAHLAALPQGELEEVRAHEDAKTLRTKVDGTIQIATLLGKGGQVKTAAKARTVYSDRITARISDRVTGELIRDAQHTEGATVEGFASGGIQSINLATAAMRRKEQAEWIKTKQDKRMVLKLSLDLRTMFDTLCPRAQFVMLRALGLPPR